MTDRKRLRSTRRVVFPRLIIADANATRDVWLDARKSRGERMLEAVGIEGEARK